MRSSLYPTGAIIAGVILWDLAVRLFSVPRYLLPAPSAVLERLITDFPFLLKHTGITFYESVGGFLLSIVIGIPLAMLLVWSRVLEKTLMPLLVVSQSFPKVAVAPLIIIWFGLGAFPKVLISFLVAFFPVVISAIVGMRSVETDVIDLARSMQASPLRTFWRIRMPFALPHIMGGLKVAVTFATVGAVVGEWVGAENGLGYLLLWSNAQLDTPLLFAVLVLLMVIGLAMYYATAAAEKILLPWHISQRDEELAATM